MIERCSDIIRINNDGMEDTRIMADIDTPAWPDLNGKVAAHLGRLMDMTMQRQWRTMLLNKMPERLTPNMPVTRHLIKRRLKWRSMTDIDRLCRITLLGQLL